MRPFSRLSGLLGVVLFCFVPGTLSNFNPHSPLVLSLNWQSAQFDGLAEELPNLSGFQKEVTLNGWERLTELWPRSRADGCQSDKFLYLTPGNSLQQALKLNPKIVKELHKTIIDLKARFNIWVRPDVAEDKQVDNIVLLRGAGPTIDVSRDYKKYWGNNVGGWMPVEVDLHEMVDKLEKFELRVTNENIFVALSCFELVINEQKTYSLEPPPEEVPLISDKVAKLTEAEASDLNVDTSYSKMAADQEMLSFLHESKELGEQKSIHEKCFRMDYILEDEASASVKIVLNYGNSSSRASTLFQERLENGQTEIEFCFNQILLFQIKDYSLSLTLAKTGNGSLIYSYKFPDFSGSLAVIHYLAPFDVKNFKKWHEQWIEDPEKLTFDENSIKIVETLEKNPKRIRFSTKWVKGTADVSYEFKVSKPDNTKFSLELCDLANLCFPVENVSTKSKLYYSPGSVYRLQATVDIFAHPADLPAKDFAASSVEIEFRLTDTNHPCKDATFCGAHGKCEIDVDGHRKCFCSKGFYGGKCELQDKCDADLKNCEGKLGCKRLDNDFVCLCGEENKPFWNKESKSCESKHPSNSDKFDFKTVKQFNFSAAELPDFKEYDLHFIINYEYSPKTPALKLSDKTPFLNVELFEQNLFRDPLRSGKHTLVFFPTRYVPVSKMATLKDLLAKFSIYTLSLEEIADLKSFDVQWTVAKNPETSYWRVKEGSDYREYFEDNLKFKNWHSFSSLDDVKNTRNDVTSELSLHSDSSFIFTTLSTDWFKFTENTQGASLSLPPPPAQGNLQIRVLSVTAVFFDSIIGHFETHRFNTSDGKLDEKSLTEHTNESFEEISKNWFTPNPGPNSYVKFNFEIYSEQTTLELKTPMTFTSKIFKDQPAVCRTEKICSNSGGCIVDLWNDITKCNCSLGHSGDDCQFTNDPCDKKKEFCNRSAREVIDAFDEPTCIAHNDTAFECRCAIPYFEWNVIEQRCVPSYYHAVNKVPFEPEAIGLFRWMSKSQYWEMKGNGQFFKSDNSAKDLDLHLTDLQSNQDLCLKIEKSTFESHIGLAINGNQPLALVDDDLETSICIRQLAAPNTKLAALSFTAPFGNYSFASFRIVSSFLSSYHFEPEKAFVLDSESYGQKWTLQLPTRYVHDIWTIDKEKKILAPDFKGETSLFSNWLYNGPEHYSFGDAHQLQFNLIFEDSDNVHIEGKVIDSKMKDITKTVFPAGLNLTSGLNKLLLPLELLPKDDYYRFALDISKKAASGQKMTAISGFSVNDFCGSDNKKCSEHGTCRVDLAEKTGFNCTCSGGYSGNACSEMDYCTKLYKVEGQKEQSGHEICKNTDSGRCESKNFGFKCNCDNDPKKIWVDSSRMCESMNVCKFANPCQTDRSKCIPETGKCQCFDDYRPIEGTNLCELKDPCKSQDNACNGKNGECFTLKRGKTETKWTGMPLENIFCHCRQGTKYNPVVSSKGKYTCEPISVCDSILTNPCQHTCTPTEDSYKCSCKPGYKLGDDTKSCVVEGKSSCGECKDKLQFCDTENQKDGVKTPICKCPANFVLKDEKCVVDPSTISNMDCPSGKANFDPDTKKIVCDCSKNPLFEEKPGKDGRCQLRQYCIDGSDELKKCQGMNSLCVVTPLTKKMQEDAKVGNLTDELFTCKCSPGLHLEGDKCVLHCKDSKIVEKCQERNANCLPTAFGIENWEKLTDMEINTKVCIDCFEGFAIKTAGEKCTFQQSNLEKVLNFELAILRQTFEIIERKEALEKVRSELKTAELIKIFENTDDLNEYLAGIAKANIELQKRSELIKGQQELFFGSKTINNNVQAFLRSKKTEGKIRVLKCNDLEKTDSVLCHFELRLPEKSTLKAEKVKEFFEESCQKIQGSADTCTIFVKRETTPALELFMAFDSFQAEGENDADLEQDTPATGSEFETLLVVETKSLDNLKPEPFDRCKKYGPTTCPSKTDCHPTDTSFECKCSITQLTAELWRDSRSDATNAFGAVINVCKLDTEKALTMCPKSSLYNGNATYVKSSLTDKPTVELDCHCADEIAIHDNKTLTINEYISAATTCVEKDFCADVQCNKGKCEQVKSGKTFVPKCHCDEGYKGDHCELEVAVKTVTVTVTPTGATKEEKKGLTDNKEELLKWIMIGMGAVLILIIISNVACLIVRSKSRDRSGSGSFIADNFELRTPHNVGTYRRSQNADPSENLPPSIQITRFGGAGNIPRAQEVHQRRSQSNIRYDTQPKHVPNYRQEPDNESHTSDESGSNDERPEVELRHVSSVGQHVRQLSAQFEQQQQESSAPPAPGQSRMSAESRFHPVYKTGSSGHDGQHEVSRSGSYTVVNPAIKNLQAATRNLGNETNDH